MVEVMHACWPLPVHAGDLLNNYCQSDPVAIVARGMFAVIAMLVYPIEVHVAREVTACVCGLHGDAQVDPPIIIPPSTFFIIRC